MTLLYNHIAPRFSKLEVDMARHIPPGGNWSDIPESVPSQRLAQIRRNGGGRTTYYGRLRWDKPSYTISTYFSRMGNGCYIHPEQERLISIREGARLQSFPDSFRFYGPKTAIYKQVGNAVPPLLAYALAKTLKGHLNGQYFIDLFSGAGGLSEGFKMHNFKPIAASEIEKPYFETYMKNIGSVAKEGFVCGNICDNSIKKEITDVASNYNVDMIAGGPPCQGFSLAGWFDKNDFRNQLFKEFVSMVSRISPKIFILENVPGMLSMENGKFVEKIIAEFESIGYHVNKPWKLNAAEFGVPQKRKRIFIIGSSSKREISPPEPILDENNFITVKDAIYGLPPLKHGEGSDEMNIKLTARSNYQKFIMGEISAEQFRKVIVEKVGCLQMA